MKKQDLILFLGIIVLVAILFFAYILTSLFFQPTTPPNSIKPSPKASIQPSTSQKNQLHQAPTPLPLPSSLPQPSAQPNLDSLISLMPVQTDFADIEYLSSGNAFVVIIKKNPYQENKTKVENWFKDMGVDPSALKIYWQTYPEVQI